MYTSAIIMPSVLMLLVLTGLYLAGRQDSIEKKPENL